ncbi:MAG: hypothetical protein ACR652_20970 [Methylocystis sp.]|uniref:hypothetical protein n=1 Tax=Methylocystis sp. TaxID=1911079 RepID=UPI003DA2C533
MSEGAPTASSAGDRARKIWLAYAILAIAGALALLAIYVNAYDDYDVGDRLRGLGRVVRRAMAILTFPLGAPAGWLADGPLHDAFGCGEETAPCAIFVLWQAQFGALVAQVVLMR